MTNILVIDDNQEVTAMLEKILVSDTCSVKKALGGRRGLQLLRNGRFDVVITDIIMPDVDGFELIMEITRMRPRPRVIVMTGGTKYLSLDYLYGVATALGVHRVLYKPFSVDDLLDAVFLIDDDREAA